MNKKIVLATATAFAFSISGPAFAQFTLHGTAVPDDQVQRIQQHCDMLESNAATSGAAAGTTDATTGAVDATSSATTGNESAPIADFENLDMDSIDVNACRDGGFLSAIGVTGAGAEPAGADSMTETEDGSDTSTTGN